MAIKLVNKEQQIYELIKSRVDYGSSPELDIELLVEKGANVFSFDEIRSAVDKFSTDFNIEKLTISTCPILTCRHRLDQNALENNCCDRCATNYSETGDEPQEEIVYKIRGEKSEDISWMIVVHGFNTDGKWQEEFSWQIANKLKYSAPILIYKYGIVRPGVLFHFQHHRIAKQLGQNIQRAIKFAEANGIRTKPDIIVHSFGSKLFVTMLEMPEFRDIKFRRVITTGSIIQPSYSWKDIISKGQIEALLNHMGGNDLAVPLAQFFIPKTGPSGKIGFTDNTVSNFLSENYDHSTYFSELEISKNISDEGTWNRFLTWPINNFRKSIDGGITDVKWKPQGRLVQWTTRTLAIIFLALILAAFFASLLIGFWHLISLDFNKILATVSKPLF